MIDLSDIAGFALVLFILLVSSLEPEPRFIKKASLPLFPHHV
jgi:hypothetical protein